MLKKIVIGLVVVIAAFLGFVATRPSEFTITRSTSINAPAEIVFEHINDFHEWQGWSPWDKIDADLKRTYSGPNAGVGATYHWEGKETGEGEMKITDSKPGEHVGLALNFMKPFPAENTVDFDLVKEGEGTKTTWRMNGKSNFMSKLFGTFVNMDKMVGADFEKGLADLKKHAEEDARQEAAKQAAPVPVPEDATDAGTP